MPRLARSLESFYDSVHTGFISPCWIWNGVVNKSGYGSYWYPRKKCHCAHRFVYIKHRGEIPDGFELDHLCRVRGCVNPDHLKIVTIKENRPNSNWGWKPKLKENKNVVA